ncbi:site-specific DNA-methyltransferase [Candidatus Poribacteria bacterium]
MEKLDPKTEGATMDIVGQNIKKLKELFPEVFTEGKVDFDTLRETLGDYIDDREERYSFSWNGKSRARRIAQTPSTGTLRPCPEESVNWDTTQNLFIEGDNLEVLKLLQKSYHRRIKMIYIDPPYNTGREFIYPDKFQDNLGTYLRYTGQIDDEGFKMSANSETSGRYHTNWLNMMYPRLKLARNLLRDDGAIFISIDDNEASNLQKICDEIFGEENFVAQIIWRKRSTPPNDKIVGAQHDYIVVYCKHIAEVQLNLRERSQKQIERYKNPDSHPKGPWAASDLTANVKGGRFVESLYFPIINPNTGEEHYPSERGNWRFNRERIRLLVANDEIYFGADGKGKPMLKRFLCDIKDGITWTSMWDFVPYNTDGSREMRSLLGSTTIFENPKPSGLIEHVLKLGMGTDGIVLDFFAGSGSTAHAVLTLNKQDVGSRLFIMVQLPEECDKDSAPYQAGFRTLAEIGKERIRRVISKIEDEQKEKIVEENETRAGKLKDLPDFDLGFKVFKLAASNIKPWDADFDNLETALLDTVENIKPDRTEADMLYELLLKYGLDLAVPIKEREISGKTVYIIGAGALIVCLAKEIGLDVVEGIAALKEELKPEVMRVVFRDAGFKDDVVKTNTMQILRQAGIEDVKSL